MINMFHFLKLVDNMIVTDSLYKGYGDNVKI